MIHTNIHVIIINSCMNFSHSNRKSYYNGMFIVKNELVDEHLENVGYKDINVRIAYNATYIFQICVCTY